MTDPPKFLPLIREHIEREKIRLKIQRNIFSPRKKPNGGQEKSRPFRDAEKLAVHRNSRHLSRPDIQRDCSRARSRRNERRYRIVSPGCSSHPWNRSFPENFTVHVRRMERLSLSCSLLASREKDRA